MSTKCGTSSCENNSEFRVSWPGREPMGMCQPCRDRALHIADAMGFYLYTEPMPSSDDEEQP